MVINISMTKEESLVSLAVMSAVICVTVCYFPAFAPGYGDRTDDLSGDRIC